MSIRLRSAGEDEMVAEIMIDNIYEWKDYKCASYLKYPWTGRITNDLKKKKKQVWEHLYTCMDLCINAQIRNAPPPCQRQYY